MCVYPTYEQIQNINLISELFRIIKYPVYRDYFKFINLILKYIICLILYSS